MENIDIASRFDEAEYYNLEDASEYLNRKYKIENITGHKLLKKAVQYEIPLFIYGKNFQLSGDYVMKSYMNFISTTNYQEQLQNHRNEILEINSKIYPKINSMLSAVMEGMGGFLKLHTETTRAFLFNFNVITDSIDESSLFNGFLPLDIPNGDPVSLDYLDEYLMKDFEDNVAFTLSMHPYIDIYPEDEEDIMSAINRAINLCTPKVVDYYLDEDNKSSYILPYFEINRDDLLILNSDVIKLEKMILNAEEPSKEVKALDSEFLKKKGVSPKKLLAKHMAKHIASQKWQADKQDKIKISEMAEIIYSELYKLGFQKELPDQVKNIKSWIKEVAPNYASEGGRPPSNNPPQP